MGFFQPKPYRVKRANKWVWVYPEPEQFITKQVEGIGPGNNHREFDLVLVNTLNLKKDR
jgi:hypothetical protein